MCMGGQGGPSPLSLAMDAAAIASGNPEAILAAAATTAGNYVQTKENNDNLQREYNAKNAVMLQGVQQQNKNTADAQGVLTNTVDKFAQPNQQNELSTLATNRTSNINANNALPSSFVDPTSNANAPKVVQSQLAGKMADAAAFGKQQADALGHLGGQQDLLNEGQMNINNSGARLGNINAIAKGQYQANQVEQQAAGNNARKSPGILGQGLSDVGTLLGLDSFSGGNMANKVFGAQPTAGTMNLVNSFKAQQVNPTSYFTPQQLADPYGSGI